MREDTINQLAQAHSMGSPYATIKLGVIMIEGLGVPCDIQHGYDLINSIAAKGNLWAKCLRDKIYCSIHTNTIQFNLPLYKCVQITDPVIRQLDTAAQSGDVFALTTLGELCYYGYGVPQSLDYAWKSLSYAAKSNVLWAKELIYEMAQNCSNLSYKYLACKEVESWGSMNDTSEVPKPSTSSTKEQPITDPMIELDNLIGLDKVKEEVRTLKNFVTVQLKRKAEGLATPSVSYHCVFSGSPGTGKTTVARILAGIYKELGILQKGHLVEVQRADLVGEYIGQTAPKTDAKIDEAIDGVLFIDEAYTLAQGGQNDYGSEAVATLLKRMEDDRERLVVILAGYDNEIRQFVNMNPGLQSRFNRYIHFDDYSHQELMEIFISNLIKNQYVIKKDAYQAVYQLIYQQIQNKDEHFGNARFVRNMFEKIIQKQANRLSKIPNPTKDQLSLIMACDIPEINLPPKEVPNKKRYL